MKEITDQGVNKIVLLSHVGYERDKQIAAAVDGIDVIVGGHSHTLLSNTDEKAAGPYPTLVKNPAGNDVPIVTAYAYSKYLGELKVVFDDAGKVKSAAGAPKLLDASVTPDAGFVARVKELAAPLEAVKAKEVVRNHGCHRRLARSLPRDGMHDGQPCRRRHARPCQGPGHHHRHPEWWRPARLHRRGRRHHGRGADRPALPEHASPPSS